MGRWVFGMVLGSVSVEWLLPPLAQTPYVTACL